MTPRTVDRVAADARAAAFTRRSIKAGAKLQGLRMAVAMTDLTSLEGADSAERTRALCRKAVCPDPAMPELPHVAAVCVYPRLVPVARAALAGSGVRVASVATAFPSGQASPETRLADVHEALAAGADEIDMVIPRGLLLAGDDDGVCEEIRAAREACSGACLKVILETGELGSYDRVRRAADLALAAGADFIKTSTGKVRPAATMGVSLVMLEAIRDHYLRTGRRAGMKPAGGIQRSRQALHYLVMVRETLGTDWLRPELFRFGASSLLDDVLMQLRRMRSGRYAAGYDVTAT